MKHIKLLSMDLQRFADDVDNPEVEETSKDEVVEEVEEKKEKTFTRSEMGKMMAAEISKQKSEWEKEYEVKLENERNEAKELASLSKDKQKEVLFNKQQEAFEAEKAEFRKEQLFVEKGKQLTVEGMPSEFAHRITGETAEEILDDVKSFRKEWDEAVEKAVNLRLVNKPTKVGGGSGTLTKSQIMDIKDPVERQKAISENRNLF